MPTNESARVGNHEHTPRGSGSVAVNSGVDHARYYASGSLRSSAGRCLFRLTTPEGVRSWWTADADLDANVGGGGEFRFYGGEKITRVRIDELTPPRRVAWTVVDSFRPEWVGTTITFDLRSTAEGTELLFAQRGYPQADENYAVCTTGWGIYFTRLSEHLKTGRRMTD
jgi:uncharacterized protein YndB with AHSA1/START domain